MKTSVISVSDKVMSIGNATFLMEEKARFQLQRSQFPTQVVRSPVLKEAPGMATRAAATRTEVRGLGGGGLEVRIKPR